MSKFLSSVIAIVLAFTIASIILLVAGLYPFDFFGALIKGAVGYDISYGTSNLYFLGEMIVYAVPVILTGLSVGFAFRTGLFNIGAEGQFIVGSFTATIIGLNFNLPPVIFPIVIILLSGLAGALWGAIPGILKATKNVHEVVVCIMLNYVALYGTNMLLRNVDGLVNESTPYLPKNALLASDFLKDLTNNSRLNWGFIVAIIATIIYHIIINKTTLGYKLRVIGFNRGAAEYAGINVKKGMVQSMAISGFFSGMAGAILILGTFGNKTISASFENYGFDGLSVALIGGSAAIGIFLAGILLGILNVSKPLMNIASIPSEIVTLSSGIIIYFISLTLVTDDKLYRLKKKREMKRESKKVKEEE